MKRSTGAGMGSVLAAVLLLASCTALRNIRRTDNMPLAVPAFEDAVAEIVTTLEAFSGNDIVRRWCPAATGSVRIVGTVRNMTPDAEAETNLSVDGTTIWGRRFERGDSIRHGIDIVAYDLTEDSQILLSVAVGLDSSRVQISTALQIIPELFVSRWQADLPTGYPVWDEEERENLRKKGQDILQQIRAASTAAAGRVVIPPGDYLFHARWSRASTLKGLRDLEIVAHGVTFWFEPPMIHALLFEECHNVTVCGLTVDFTIPICFQARIAEIDRESQTIRATLMEGYGPCNADGEPETRGERTFMFYDTKGRFINHRHTPGIWELSGDGRHVCCSKFSRNQPPDALQLRDYIVGSIRTGAAVRSHRCSGMRFENVNIWSSPGIAVNERGGEGGNVYYRVRATRRPHTNRLQAFGADVFHLAGTDRGPVLDRCEMAYGADDTLNIHGSFGRVVQRVDDCRYYLEGAYHAGDTLEFRDMRSLELLGMASAVAVERTPEGPSLPINEKHRANGEWLVQLDQPLELPPLTLVVMDGRRSAAGFIVRNCWLHDDFQRALINGAPGGVIENNTFQNVGQALCIQFETWGPWMEGPFARELTVCRNRFIDAPPAGPAVSVSMHPPGGGSNRRRFEARPVTDMTMNGNTFSRTEHIPISIHNVDGLKIHGNSIDRIAEDTPAEFSGWLYLQDCDNVSVRDNECRTGWVGE